VAGIFICVYLMKCIYCSCRIVVFALVELLYLFASFVFGGNADVCVESWICRLKFFGRFFLLEYIYKRCRVVIQTSARNMVTFMCEYMYIYVYICV